MKKQTNFKDHFMTIDETIALLRKLWWLYYYC